MPGEIRCPTCGRTTPIAPQCLHCGGTMPDASGRPRGLDREELEERIRMRRSGDNPFHRGSADWHEADAAWGGAEFVPEPSDVLARREPPPADEVPPRVDYLAESPPGSAGWSSDTPGEPPTPAPSWPSAARPEPPAGAYADPRAATGLAPDDRYGSAPPGDGGYGDDGYRYGDDGYGGYDAGAYRPDGGDPGGPGRTGVLAVLGFVILGVAARAGGVILFSLMSSSPGAAEASPTPTAVATPSATEEATPGESAGASPSSSAAESAGATATPTETSAAVPPDFTAQAQPCATSDMDFHGCTQDGSTVSGSKIWIWVGFRNARSSDVIGVTVLDHADGSSVGDGSIELVNIGCKPDKPCTGYIQMPFSQLGAGDYDIQVSLNETQVATSAFSVTG